MKKNIVPTLVFILMLSISSFSADASNTQRKKQQIPSDREYWVDLCYRLAAPVLSNMSRGELKKNMTIEFSPTWDNRPADVAYLETFGRLMAGVAPWLSLPDDDSREGKMRKELREWALMSYKNAVDPQSPDCLEWRSHTQCLVDAAYVANSFIRAPETLWEPLDELTKQRYIDNFRYLCTIRAWDNNWVLFRGMIEAFFIMIGESYDGYALELVIRKIESWYVGDGWYSDGPEFSFDNYNSYVIQPMLVEILDIMEQNKKPKPISMDLAVRRMQRYNIHIERLISPEGTYPAFGRSATYRLAVFQTLALSSWKYGLGNKLTPAQVRSGITAVMKRMYAMEGNFDAKGFLRLGFVGHQPDLADYYTNSGSLYMTSLVFLPLGLAADEPFWTDPAEPWTSLKAWSGEAFPKDYHESVRK